MKNEEKYGLTPFLAARPPEPCVWGGITWSADCSVMHADMSVSGFITVELHTGGKSLSHQTHLFTISGGANELLPPPDPRSFSFGLTEDYIEPTRIQVLGEYLGFDGLLHKMLPDNEVVPVTPKIDDVLYFEFSFGE